MARDPIPTYFFVLVVVRRGDEFLLVHEAKHGQLWYLPAGGVEPGETLVAAAHRETLEEAGLPIELEGILRVEHTPGPDHCRVRVIYLARPADDRTPPKSEPDTESLEARWFRLDELDAVALRSEGVSSLLAGVAGGAEVWPLSLIRSE